MWLDLREIIEIPGGKVPFECELETDLLDFPAVRQYIARPHASGVVFNEAGILRLQGEISSKMLCVCDRCGAEFAFDKTTVLDAVIVEDNTSDDPELFVLEGDGIDLDELLSTCFILDMDTKLLCSKDCKGLCPSCGANLNHGMCSCRKQIDPRFAVLEQLLDK